MNADVLRNEPCFEVLDHPSLLVNVERALVFQGVVERVERRESRAGRHGDATPRLAVAIMAALRSFRSFGLSFGARCIVVSLP